MPTFSTPEPIAVSIELAVGDVRLVASERTDTVVEVRPSNVAHEADVRAAEDLRVDFSSGALAVKTAERRGPGLFGRTGSVDVTIQLPSGSQLHGVTAAGTFHGTGRLGECRMKAASGDIRLDGTGAIDVDTSSGTVEVNHVAGDADVRTASGDVRLRRVDGNALAKSANGSVTIGDIGGDLRVATANGDVSVDRGGRTIAASTAKGDLRVGETGHGPVALETAYGQIEVGIPAGTAARLDARTSLGRIDNRLDSAERPEPSDRTIDVRARTAYGDVVIRRSTPAPAAGPEMLAQKDV